MKTTTMRTLGIVAISSVVALSSCKKPEAGFEANKTTVAVGEQVSLTDPAEDRKNAVYYYDMGDGTTYSERNPSHIYSKAGVYKVQQTINFTKNAEKRSGKSVTHSIDITVNGPEAAVSASNTSPAVGEGVNFSNDTKLQSEEGSEVYYSWNVRNANSDTDMEFKSVSSWTGTDINAVYKFWSAGEYVVTLVATQGQTRSYAEVTISVYGSEVDDAHAATYAKMDGTWSVAVTGSHTGTLYTDNSTCGGNGTPVSSPYYSSVTLNRYGNATKATYNLDPEKGNITSNPYLELNIIDDTHLEVFGNWIVDTSSDPLVYFMGDPEGIYSYTVTDSKITLTRTEKSNTGGACSAEDTWTLTLTK